MINREQLKREIDLVNDAYLEILHRIIQAFTRPSPGGLLAMVAHDNNPLKGSVLFEGDLIAPIDEPWDADQ